MNLPISAVAQCWTVMVVFCFLLFTGYFLSNVIESHAIFRWRHPKIAERLTVSVTKFFVRFYFGWRWLFWKIFCFFFSQKYAFGTKVDVYTFRNMNIIFHTKRFFRHRSSICTIGVHNSSSSGRAPEGVLAAP